MESNESNIPMGRQVAASAEQAHGSVAKTSTKYVNL